MSDVTLSTVDDRPFESASEWRALAAIALPVVIVQVGLMLMGVVDTLMVGHLSANALASVALGNLYFFNTIVVAMGVLMALDPLVAQAVGARDHPAITRAVQRGMVLSVLLALITMLGMMPVGPLLWVFRQPAEVIPDAASYVHISAIGVWPFLAFTVLRQTLQAVGRLAPIVWTIVIANVVNALLNWILIFGKWGAPALGVAGSAIATAIARTVMFAVLFALAWKDLRPHLSVFDRNSIEAVPLWRMFALGFPIGLQMLLEYSAFAAVGLLMGTFGALQVGAHQIALNLAALTFMVPLGVSAAAAVRVGQAVGAEDPDRTRRAAWVSYVLGAGFMVTTAILFVMLPRPLAAMYSDDMAVVAIAASLIPIAGVFQVVDGAQAVGAGVLRGLGDTRVPLIAMLSGYWLIGVPVSVWLGFRTDLGPVGLWWGFVAGLGSVAVFLLIRVQLLLKRGVTRLEIDRRVRA